MNKAASFVRLHFPLWPNRLQTWLRSDEGQLTLIWLVRFILLWVVTSYFISSDRKPDNPLLLGYLKTLLLIFWGYVVFIGGVGVYRPKWQLSPKIKRLQVAIEIMLFTTLLLLAQDPNSAIYYAYFLPLIVAAEYLPPRWSIAMVILALAGFMGAQAILPDRPPYSSFWPQAFFLVAVFFLFLLGTGRRRSVLEDAKNDSSEVMDILNRHDEGVFVIDEQRRLRYVNEILKQKHGSFEPGHLCENYFNCSTKTCNWCLQATNTNYSKSLTMRQRGVFYDRGGHPYQVETMAFPLLNEENKQNGAIVFVRNIEERRELENHLQQITNQQELWRETYDAMGKKLASFSDLGDMMQFLVSETKKRLGAETTALFLLENGRLVRKAIAGIESSWFSSEDYALGEGITGKAVQPREGEVYARPHLSNEVHTHPEVIRSHLTLYTKKLKSGVVRHLIAVPLNKEDGSFGVLRIVNKLTNTGQLSEEGFTQQDVDFLITLASMVALAIENKHLLDRAKQGLAEIKTLLDVNQSIAQTLDLDRLLLNIVYQARRISGGDKCLIQMIDEQTQTLVPRISDSPSSSGGENSPIHINQGVAGRAIRNRREVYVPDTKADPDFLDRGGESLRSLLVIPLFAGRRALGLLNVNSDRKNAFSEDQIRQLKALAAPASIAIEKAQLYKKTRALHQVTALVNTRLDQSEIFDDVLRALQQLVSFDSVSIQLLDEDNLIIIHASGFEDDRAVEGIVFPAHDPKFPNHQVIEQKAPIIIDDVRDQYCHFLDEADAYYSQSIRNWLGVPLIREDQVIGMIALDKKTAAFYTQTDADLALSFANHLAIALENISLYEAEAKQAKMLSSLVEASRGLITHSSLRELYEFCAVQGAKIFTVEDCSLSIIDEERSILDLVSSTCLPPEICAQSETPLDANGLRTYVIRRGETLNFGEHEYKNHQAWSGKYLEHLNFLPSQKCHSLLLSPLVDGQGRIRGVIRLENKLGQNAGTKFTEVEVALLKTFSSHVGTAIERIQLYNRLDAEARLKARESLSHDLHDTASFVHGALVLRTAVAGKLIKSNAYAELSKEVEHLHKAARHTYTSIRLLHQDSRDPLLEQGLFFALRRFASMLSLKEIKFRKIGSRELEPDVTYGLYKIGQEAISNAARHAGENVSVLVTLKVDDDFKLKIEDNGRGFDVEKTKKEEDSFGLQGMSRWAKSIKGTLTIKSKPGKGTTVKINGHLVSGDE